MKISYQWLKRYIDTDLELDEILTVLLCTYSGTFHHIILDHITCISDSVFHFYHLLFILNSRSYSYYWSAPEAAFPATYPLAQANVRLYPPHMPSTSRISPAK